MRIRLRKRWNGFKTDMVRDVSEGVANLLVRRGIAEIVRDMVTTEAATQPEYSVSGRRAKAAR